MSATAARLGARVLRSPHFQEPGRVYRQSPGFRNQYGEFEPGGFSRADVLLVTWPVTGQERTQLPEGLREKEMRRFVFLNDVRGVSPEHEGDAVWHDNRFYRVEIPEQWAGFRSVLASYPFTGDIQDVTRGRAFTSGFSGGFS